MERKLKTKQDFHEYWNEISKMENRPSDEEIMDELTKCIINDKNLLAKTIAAFVRNSMEDFHVKYLTDEQMKELNPIIRNAIYTILQREELLLGYFLTYVPDYWEDCEEIAI